MTVWGLVAVLLMGVSAYAAEPDLTLAREANWLIIKGPHLPGGDIRINYLEAYCRANSADTDWMTHTVIKHISQKVSVSPDGKAVALRDTLKDGVVVDHIITAGRDTVDFRVVARNPTQQASEVHWAQPCVRLARFTGFSPDLKSGDLNDYLQKCFIFLDRRLTRMPTPEWVTKARYIPGQVWRPSGVPPSDVNPRPLNPRTPDNGLIGCFSADDKLIFATAWEPYQELFQGVARCLHSDFRIGGLRPGETKRVRGRIYIVGNDPGALLKRYNSDFPEHRKRRRSR